MGNPHFRPVEQCIFCPNPADSREHAWSRWAIDQMEYPGGIAGMVDGVAYYDPNQRHLRVPCVCESCNTGWMKAIEDQAKPLIERMMIGCCCDLTADQQVVLTKWAVIKAMVVEHASSTHTIFFTDADRRNLKEAGQIPDDTRVWLAMSAIDTFYTKGTPVVIANLGHGLVITLMYYRFAAQVVAVKFHRPVRSGEVLTSAHVWSDAIVRIWSPRALAMWPGRMVIGESAIEAFHQRFEPHDV